MSKGYRYWDVLVILLLVPAAIACAAMLQQTVSEADKRIKCASNLQQIGQALLLYANENGGNYPRTAYSPADSDKPVWGTGAQAKDPFAEDGVKINDVTAPLFLLLRTQDLSADTMVCPSTTQQTDTFEGGKVQDRSNFTDLKKNLSYSYANPYPSEEVRVQGYALNSVLGADFVVVADTNPGTAGGDDDALAAKPKAAPEILRKANSNNHGGEGQNVLYGDGMVKFTTTALCGLREDNIYTSTSNKVVAAPAGREDSVLLPTDD